MYPQFKNKAWNREQKTYGLQKRDLKKMYRSGCGNLLGFLFLERQTTF